MKYKYIGIVIIGIFISTACFSAEDLSHITRAGGTVYFADDFESGYQYLGAANAHAGGGYWSLLGGSIDGDEGTGCSDTGSYHNTIISNDASAQGAVSGSQYSLKTPYDGECTGESYSRDTSILDLGSGDNGADKTEVYVRWYQKFTGAWNSSTVQHKFTKFCGNSYNVPSGSNTYMTSAHFSFGPGTEYWRAWVNNYNGQFDKFGGYFDDSDEGWIYQTEAHSGSWGYDDINNGIGDGGADGESIFQVDTWYCIEIHVKMNSSDEAYDGELEAWVDGVKVFELKNFQYYTTGQTPYGIGYIEFQHIYYIRTATDQPTYMDNIVVADTYIGPMGSGSTPASRSRSGVSSFGVSSY